jgi:hypothetical protein
MQLALGLTFHLTEYYQVCQNTTLIPMKEILKQQQHIILLFNLIVPGVHFYCEIIISSAEKKSQNFFNNLSFTSLKTKMFIW